VNTEMRTHVKEQTQTLQDTHRFLEKSNRQWLSNYPTHHTRK